MPRHIEVAALSNLRDVHTNNGVKYSKEEREARRAQIADLRLRGFTFIEIGEKVDLSSAQAYREYKVVEQRWRVQAFDSLVEIKARELARIDTVENEAWRAYERSQEAVLEDRRHYDATDGRAQLAGSSVKKVNRDGDAKWLRIIGDCIDRRIKLFGLDAPELRGGSHGHSTQDDRSIETRLSRYQGIFGYAIIERADGTPDHTGVGESVDSSRPPPEAGRVFDADAVVRDTTP